MDYYTCERCEKRFDEFDMNYRQAQIDKKCLCRECRENDISDSNYSSDSVIEEEDGGMHE